MESSTMWWVLCGALIALELATGTFYLLMLALGAAAGALAAHAGLSDTLQIALAAIVGAVAAGAWHMKQRHAAFNQPLGTQGSPDLSLDLGQTIMVTDWQADGSTQVLYRGSPWTARLKPDTTPLSHEPGPHRICAMQGNFLILEKV